MKPLHIAIHVFYDEERRIAPAIALDFGAVIIMDTRGADTPEAGKRSHNVVARAVEVRARYLGRYVGEQQVDFGFRGNVHSLRIAPLH